MAIKIVVVVIQYSCVVSDEHVVLTCINGVSPSHLLVIVASDRLWLSHIVDTRPLPEYEGGLNLLYDGWNIQRLQHSRNTTTTTTTV